MSGKPVERPRTLVPPPLVYAAGIGAAWWLQHRYRPLNWSVPVPLHLLAWVLLVVGALLMAWAAITIWRHKTTVNPYKAASALVTRGPFAFSRNPIYVADAISYFAGAILMGSLWPFIFAPLVWLVMRYAVIAHEETHLLAKFGTEYAEYCARVRRWL